MALPVLLFVDVATSQPKAMPSTQDKLSLKRLIDTRALQNGLPGHVAKHSTPRPIPLKLLF